MKENFSKRVQLIIKNAKEEAVRLGHSYVGSEHLLLGMIKDSTGLSIKIFEIYDCNIIDLKSMIEDIALGPKPSIFSNTLILLEDEINTSRSLNSFAKISAFTSPINLIPSE